MHLEIVAYLAFEWRLIAGLLVAHPWDEAEALGLVVVIPLLSHEALIAILCLQVAG